ncbi:MAG TPA: ComF family protein [Dehalococcoidia bacterium]|nr:ComF family protein [Dehalococcoidia bacterium]
MALLRGLARLALDTLFPVHCLGCGEEGQLLCPPCLQAAPRAVPPRCPICWQRWPGESPCRHCVRQRPAYEAVRSAFAYDGAVREAVHCLKFRGISALAAVMAVPMAQLLAAWAPPADALVPVPLPWLRERYRGYDQAHLLAREMGRALGLPVLTGALARAWTRPQASLSGDERRRNVGNAFRPRRPLHGLRLVLVDDVATTGATLDACARALLQAGARGVWAVTFAREG